MFLNIFKALLESKTFVLLSFQHAWLINRLEKLVSISQIPRSLERLLLSSESIDVIRSRRSFNPFNLTAWNEKSSMIGSLDWIEYFFSAKDVRASCKSTLSYISISWLSCLITIDDGIWMLRVFNIVPNAIAVERYPSISESKPSIIFSITSIIFNAFTSFDAATASLYWSIRNISSTDGFPPMIVWSASNVTSTNQNNGSQR